MLDTHVVLWWMAGEHERLGDNAAAAIDAPDANVLISAVVVWEVAIKRRIGKLDAPADLLERLESARIDLLPITARHADRVGTLPMLHRDPFDRLLVAQAEIDGLAVVSADSKLSDYGIEVIW
ncbi:MAG: type II toxin-antitoxin system VapC family toxin [Chloroflexota bacterium]